MNWLPFISRARYDTDLAAAHADTYRARAQRDEEVAQLRSRVLATEARHDEAESKRRRLARWLADAEAANRRLHGRNLELGRRISSLTEADPDYAADMEKQLTDAQNALAAATKRADQLQQRLDDACGLNTPAIAAGDSWQERREQRMRFDQPTTTKETTS